MVICILDAPKKGYETISKCYTNKIRVRLCYCCRLQRLLLFNLQYALGCEIIFTYTPTCIIDVFDESFPFIKI